jgi:phage recombination protein Bet
MATQALSVSRYDQPEMVDTIRATVAKGANDSQLRMFLEVCKRTGLDPFLKEVWFIAQTSTIMAGRDGYLRVANEDPQFDGMETRVERDQNNLPIKATCSVWRKDRTHAITCEAYFSEYVKTSPVWRQYPSAMISKVAEVLALKRSFSINGVVTEEEIGDGMPRGSAEAAQEAAQRKIIEMQKPQPAAELAEEVPEEWEQPGRFVELGDEIPSQLEQELHDSIVFAEKSKPLPKRRAGYFQMLEAFGQIKSRYESIGFLKTYYGYLSLAGVRHSNDFPDTEEGLQEARICFKAMSIDVANREVRGRK